MGQFYSTSQEGSGAGEHRGGKNDYYELLGVQWDSSEEDIKKAYRKKALELHPDRNYGNVEAATELFAEIQSAYQVLSDPQERAWYNSHREVFLGGKAETGSDHFYNTRLTTSNDILSLIPKFSPRMEFTDSQSGFYGGLREIFSRLAWEEKMACQSENLEFVDYPTFGYRGDSFEGTVRVFYAIWSSFSTKKSFAWKDIYRYSEAPDRRVRRLMEKENKRSRDEGIREFNSAVRSLVSFTRKRDPRYKHNMQSEAQRQEALRQSTSAQATRSRIANQANMRDYAVPDWAKPEEPIEYMDDSPESDAERFDCIVCEKSFKSQQQFQTHTKSKKHIKAVKKLRSEMTAEDELWDLQASENDNNKAIVDEQNHPAYLDYDSNIPGVDDEPISKDSSVMSRDQDFTDGFAESTNNNYNNHKNKSTEGIEAYPSRPAVSTPQEYGSQNAIDEVTQQLSNSELKEPTKKMGKAKQKHAKKAAKKSESPELTCAACHLSFNSKNQLFTHIKKLDHAQPLPSFTGKKGG